MPRRNQTNNRRVAGRVRNRRVNGRKFDDATILAVWAKARRIRGKDPAQYRRDAFGATINFHDYGQLESLGGGWEIDHILPVSLGGTDVLENLQPLQWQNNRRKGDRWPDWLDMDIWIEG